MKETPTGPIWRSRPEWLVRLRGHLPALGRVGRRWVFVPLISVFSLLAVLNFGVAWYYSGVIRDLALEVREDEVEYEFIAADVGEGLVRLEKGPDEGEWRLRGKWGLKWDGGSGMIGDIMEDGGDFLIRRFTMADGFAPRSSPAFVSSDIYPNDPYLAFGIEYEEVEYETPLGRQDAWRFEGDDDT